MSSQATKPEVTSDRHARAHGLGCRPVSFQYECQASCNNNDNTALLAGEGEERCDDSKALVSCELPAELKDAVTSSEPPKD
eukprot:141029-Prymnesium_polylepis.1